MNPIKSSRQLAKSLVYILGRRPDEFGLAPDPDGYVKIKDLLKVLQEEEGWKHVRRHHLDEIPITLPEPPIEIKDPFIRATLRDRLPVRVPAESLPKVLYTCIRRRAYPTITERGMSAPAPSEIILFATREAAERNGRRCDARPVLLNVHTAKSLNAGVVFYRYGPLIFIAHAIPAGCFSGPPLPKQKPAAEKKAASEQTPPPPTPGSYLIDLTNEKPSKGKTNAKRGKKEIPWKKERKIKNRRVKKFDTPF